MAYMAGKFKNLRFRRNPSLAQGSERKLRRIIFRILQQVWLQDINGRQKQVQMLQLQ